VPRIHGFIIGSYLAEITLFAMYLVGLCIIPYR